MRPIPAPRIGDSHGLLRAIEERGRLRTDEFVTEFSLEQLFPPELENALGRMRHFISYARAAGLVKEDRGVVELTDVGRRYVRAGDGDRPFDVSPQQAEWMRRQLREKHMTDSIFHGLAIGLSLLASCPPPGHVSKLDFGRSLAYLGRAGWDNENTFQIQGERYLDLLADIELIDADHRLTETGALVRGELTLPVHMGLLDIAAQLNPGGAEAVRAEAEAEWSRQAEPAQGAADQAAEEDVGYQDVGPGAWSPSAPSTSNGEGALPAPEPAPATPDPAPMAPPVPPADIWETAGPDEATRAIPAARPPLVPRASEPSTVPAEEPAAPGAMTSGDPLAAGAPTIVTPGQQPAATPGGEGGPSAASAPPPGVAASSPPPATAGPPDVPSPAAAASSAPPAAALPPDVPSPAAAASSAPPAAAAPPEESRGGDVASRPPAVAAPPEASRGADVASSAPPAAAAPPEVASPADAASAPGSADVATPPVGAPAPPVGSPPPDAVSSPPPAAAAGSPNVAAAGSPDVAAPGTSPPPAAAAGASPPAAAGSPNVASPPPAAVASAPPPAAAELRGGGAGFVDPAVLKAAAEEGGLRLPVRVYANVAAALGAGKHVLLTGAPGSGKTALALAIARAASQAGRSQGATLVTARHWDVAGPDLLVDCAKRGRWVIVDELDREQLDRALGPLSSFLSGLPVLLPNGEEAAPEQAWRILATSGAGVPGAAAALLRRFAVIEVPGPAPDVLEAAIREAAGGDPVAAAAVLRLVPLADVAPLGAGVFLDAARHAAARHAALPADESTLAREAFAAYVAPLLGDLDDLAARRIRDLLGDA